MHRIPIRYLVKRFAYFIAVIWFAATVNFLLPRLAARDPVMEHLSELSATGGQQSQWLDRMADSYREWAGLNQSLWRQYVQYMRNMMRMDFGRSFRAWRPVTEIIADALPWTIALLGLSTVIAFIIGTILGAWIGWRKSSKLLNVFVPILMLLSVLPPFILALVLIDVFAFRLHLFPLRGAYSPTIAVDWSSWDFWLDVIHHGMLPALSMILVSTGIWAMGMRGMIITVVGLDFMTFGEAKGLKRWRLFLEYAVRNVILPQMTQLAMSLGVLVSGYTLVEAMFGYPGVGTMLANAIRAFDYNLIQGIVFYLISAIAIATFVLDLIYPLLDPRISYG